MFSVIRQDLRRCGHSTLQRMREVVFNPAMWAVLGYRYRRFIAETFPRPIRWLFAPFSMMLQLALEILTHVQLPLNARIGPGLYLPHLGTIVIGSGSTIGENCTVTQNVTIGHAGGRSRGSRESPIIGNRVYIGPGAIIIGPITIGDDALIGAGALVVKSVPPRAVVVGNPARVIAMTGSFSLIEYPGMEDDPHRTAAQRDAALAGTQTVGRNARSEVGV